MSTGDPKFPPMPTVIAGTNAAPASAVTATLGYVSPGYHADVVARLEARVAELEATLRGIEWEGRNIAKKRVCPACDMGPEHGHVPNCPVAIALGATASVRVADDASVEASIARIGRTHEGLIKALAHGEDARSEASWSPRTGEQVVAKSGQVRTGKVVALRASVEWFGDDGESEGIEVWPAEDLLPMPTGSEGDHG